MKLKPIRIQINGKPFTVFSDKLTWLEVIDMAGISHPPEWRSSHQASQPVYVDNGTHITVKP